MTNASILIVEDEAIVAADLGNKLRRLGYTVAGSTARGEEALALTRERCPALVLMDIRLAGAMDGVEAAEHIRRECDVPVIYLTAHADRATLDRAKRTEPFGYLLKPFAELELETHIEMALYKHQIERRLRESEQRWATTLASIGDAVITSDCNGLVTFLNPVAVALTGWTSAEALGQPITQVFHIINEQTREPAADLVARVLRENRAVELANHTALLTRDGEAVPVEDSAAPITDAAGHVTGVVIVFHDVTEKRHAEEARARLAAIVASSHDAIIGKTLDGTITSWNSAAERLFGYPAAEALGQSIDLVMPPDRAGELEDILARVARGETVEHYESVRVTKAGQRFDVSVTVSPIKDADGQIVGASCIKRDVTERKAADRAKDEFLAVLSHELQTPLTNMLGWSEMALDRQSAEFMTQAMEVVRRNAVRQKRLVDELLVMSRLIHHKIALVLEQTDGRTQVRQAVENVQPDAADRRIALVVDPLTAPLPLRADPVRLQQCLGNLLHNSLKFTPEGGTITVGCHREGDEVIFYVHDTGRGIDAAALPALFALFRQVDRDERAGGLGLGLAVVRGIVELHGGRVWADSPGLGQGSTFYLAFPLATE